MSGIFPEGERPLKIAVTAVGKETAALGTLIRQAIPMLTDPSSFERDERLRLAKSLEQILCGEPTPGDDEVPFALTDADAPLEADDVEAYEPGCLPEDPWS